MATVCIILCLFVCAQTILAQKKKAPCLVDGVSYPSGTLTPDPCNRCWCLNGRISCRKLRCLKAEGLAPCIINGEPFASGEETPDLCNRCTCKNGVNICRTIECNN